MLRWRLLIGLVSVFVLLLAAGGYSIWLITSLQGDIDGMLKDNYESIRNAHNLRLAMLRLNAAYLKPRVADVGAIGPEALDSVHAPEIERRITALRLLSRTPEQKREVERLSGQLATYVESVRALLALGPTEQTRYEDLRADLLRQNLTLTDTTERLLRSHEAIMLASQEDARRLARDTVGFLIGAMVLAAAVLGYTYFRLGRSLVTPIESLTRSIDAVRGGEFGQIVPVKSNDELSRLTRAFNTMAGELAAYRRDTNETILHLNRSLRETIAAFPHPVLLLDAQFEIWVTNQAANAFLEGIRSPDQLPPPIQRHLEETRATNRDYLPEEPRDAILFRVAEREVHYLPRILRIFSPDGHFSGVAIILIDVTRFRWLDDIKTNQISTISHEIKTPLTGIRMILHLLREGSGGDLTPAQQEMIQAACDDCERLLATLNGLLDLSRMEAGRTQLALRPVSPGELLEQTRAAFQAQADARGLELRVEAVEDLPPVLADSSRIAHVLGNFVSNALKFAPMGTTIRLAAEPTGDSHVRFSVIDHGPGVPESYHARIFDKFFRAPGQQSDGVGLGLCIAREIVLAHDGRIGMQSSPGVETRFHCELPLAPA